MSRRSARHRGVTLIEMVVGITIASAVLGAGYAGLSTALDRRESAIALLETDLAATTTRSTVRRWLEGAYLVPEASGALFTGVDADVDGVADDQLTLLTSAPTPLGAGRAVVRLYVDRNEETPEVGLVADVSAWLGTERVRVQLAEHVAGMELLYRSDLVGGGRPLPSWITSSVLPGSVELRLIGDRESEALHPILTYPIRVSLVGGR